MCPILLSPSKDFGGRQTPSAVCRVARSAPNTPRMTPSGGPLFLVSELEELRELSEEVCAKRNDELEVEVLDRLGEIDEASEMVELFSPVTSSFSRMGAVKKNKKGN